MKVLGIRSAKKRLWLAVVESDAVLAEPDRLELTREPRPAALETALEQLEVLLRENSIEAVAVADAHTNVRPRSFNAARDRLTLEILLEVASSRTDVTYQVLTPQGIQAALGLSSRRIADHVADFFVPVGTHWNERGPAALAALAVQRERDR